MSKYGRKSNCIKFEDYHKYEMICFECSRLGTKDTIFYDESSYQEHHLKQHESANKHKKGKLRCSECNKESVSWYNFSAHITTHREHCQPPWICTIGKGSYRNKRSSKKKQDANWDGTEICGKACSTRHNLIKHQEGFHGYRVVYKKKGHAIAAKNRNKNKANKPTIIADLPIQFVSRPQIKQVTIHNVDNDYKQKKLRPKMKFISDPISSKRSRNDYESNLRSPKKRRIQPNVDQQMDFLNLLHKAATHLNEYESEPVYHDYHPSLSPATSSLSPSPEISHHAFRC